MIELLIAIAIIGIVAAMAIPGLVRARMAGSEASAIGSLRMVVKSQASFASTCGSGYYAPTLARLATPPVAGSDGFISPDLSTDPSVKSGYRIAMTPGPAVPAAPASCNGAGPGAVVSTYFASADPLPQAGVRHFATNQGGGIFYSTAVIPVTQMGAPAGAQPIN